MVAASGVYAVTMRDYKRKGRAAAFQAEDRGVRLSNPAPFLAILLVAGCAQQPIIKTVEVPVTKYVKQKIDPSLLKPCVYAEPDKACWRGTTRDWCNGQIVQMLVEYRAALATCNSQIEAIKDAQK